MNWSNGQPMAPIEKLRAQLVATLKAEREAWDAGRVSRAMHLNAHVSGLRRSIREQEAERAACAAQSA